MQIKITSPKTKDYNCIAWAASTLSVKFSNVAYLKDRGSNIRKHV